MSQNDNTPPRGDSAQDGLQEAFDLWREDAGRAADRIDVTGDLADRVVAAAREGRPLAIAPAGARWYAAAAVLLMAIGISGTLMARDAGATTDFSGAPRWADLDATVLIDVVADDPTYAPGLEGRAPGPDGREGK